MIKIIVIGQLTELSKYTFAVIVTTIFYLLVGRHPADYSDATVALWLYIYVVSIFVCFVVTFRSRFHSDYLAPSTTALSKRPTMIQMF